MEELFHWMGCMSTRLNVLFVTADSATREMLAAIMPRQDLKKLHVQRVTFCREDYKVIMEIKMTALPAVVFLDSAIAEDKGIELLRRIKAENKDSYVVLLAAHMNEHEACTARECGASGIILRPFSLNKFSDHILGCYQKNSWAEAPDSRVAGKA